MCFKVTCPITDISLKTTRDPDDYFRIFVPVPWQRLFSSTITTMYKAADHIQWYDKLRSEILNRVLDQPITTLCGKPDVHRHEVLRAADLVSAFGRDLFIRIVTLPALLPIQANIQTVNLAECPACSDQRWMRRGDAGVRCGGCGVEQSWKDCVVKRPAPQP